jgi:hypothetical protein
MFPVIGVLSLLTARGLLTLTPSRARPGSMLGLSGILMVIAAIAPFRYIAPVYAQPPTVEQVPGTATPVSAHWDGVELVAIEAPLAAVTEGGWVPITLYWRTTRSVTTNYSLFLHALGRDNQEIGKIDSYLGGGALPTTRLQPGVIVKDSYRVPLTTRFDAPTRIRMLIGMGTYSPGNYLVVPATKTDGSSFGNLVVDAGVAYPQDASRCAPARPADARLLGSLGDFAQVWTDTSELTARPGDKIPVSLYWDRLAGTSTDWTVFVHLVGGDGRNLAQADSPPLNNDYPTSLWRLPCEIHDVHILQIPADAPSGEYRIFVGLYDAGDPAYPRAVSLAADGSSYPDNAMPVSSIRVEAP